MAKNKEQISKKIKTQNFAVLYSLTTIVLLTLLVYSPSFKGEFLNWDDDAMIIENPMVKSISIENLQAIFSTPQLNSYNPLVFIVYSFVYNTFRLDPAPYHFINILLHIINSLLVFWLVFTLCQDNLIAVFTAILFSIHPAHVEAVSWITSLKELLFTFFYLFSLISYIDYINDERKISYYTITFVFFLLSLLSKPFAVTIPAALVLLDYYVKKKVEFKTILRLIPFFVISLLFAVIAVLTFSKGGMVKSEYSFANNIFIFFHTLVFYLYKLILPVNLSPIYPQPNAGKEWLPVIYYISPLILAGIAWLIVKFGKKLRVLIFGSLFFVITILPASNLIPVKNNSLLFDRFTYLPYIGIMFAFAWFAVNVYYGTLFLKKKKPQLILIAGILIISLLSYASYQRAGVWCSSHQLWSDMIEKYPDEPKGYFNMGDSYFRVKDFNRAINYFDKAISIDSSNYTFFNDRGNAFREQKIYDRSIADYKYALSIKPDEYGVYNNMGIAYGYKKDFDSALYCYRKSLELSPSYIDAQLNLGSYYYNSKNYDSALTVFNNALQMGTKNPVVYYSLGLTYFNRQDFRNAKECFMQTIKFDPENELAYQKLTLTYLLNKEYDKAWENIYVMKKKKYQIDGKFLEMLQKESGRMY